MKLEWHLFGGDWDREIRIRLTLEAWEILNAAEEIWLRTKQHPTVAKIPTKTELHTFDEIL